MLADGKSDTALGLGERLRSARKARALTLEQAAFTLRLEVPVLRALEDERYEALGAAVFVRGHLKAYAKLLGLSEEAVLAAYRAADPQADAPPKVTRELEKPLTTTPGPLAILAAVALALLAMLVLYLLGAGTGPAPSGPAPALEALPPGETRPPVGPEPVPIPLPLPLPEAEPAPAATEPAPAAGAPPSTPATTGPVE
ncbi:MAG: helix-turn-helix domain-containing protein [Chromatiales bacterium]|nr:helix-turn-helix domain-containing protein [Chromatiales bacterium]